jgi:cell wall-associated NlpC family hydrolase
VPLPRDAREQVAVGAAVDPAAIATDDLCFFRGEETDAITHVAIAVSPEAIVHAVISTGMVTREPWTDGSRAASLRQRLVAVRRLT